MNPLRFHSLTKLTLAAILFTMRIGVAPMATATPFITSSSYDMHCIIPPPPQVGSDEYKRDTGYLKNARDTATAEQLSKGIAASHDSVFDYSESLGSWFSSKNLPKTTIFFNKVDRETKKAIVMAKNHFVRARPLYWLETGDPEKSDGFSYPSGHTTRAFVWADLLANAFPEERQALHRQARQKAWYRVILGRHFPADVRAGKIYGKFLAAQFLKSPEFQKSWPEVVAEMQTAQKASAPHS